MNFNSIYADTFFMYSKRIAIFFFFFLTLNSINSDDIWDEIDLELKKYIENLDLIKNQETEKALEEISTNKNLENAIQFNNTSNPDNKELMEYIVQENDTLFQIAKRFNMNLQDVFSLNPFLEKQGRIFIGDKLKVYKQKSYINEEDWIYRRVIKIKVKKYKVKKGDTLLRIAKKFNTHINTIISFNKSINPHKLRINQILTVNKKKIIKEYKLRNYFQIPVQGGYLSSSYGYRVNPFIPNMRNFHKGVDIVAEIGTPIYTAREGVVIYSGRMEGYGNVIFIRHIDNYITVYAHNKVNLVKVGDIVRRGTKIAEVGRTGYVTGPHLHFEVRKLDKPINPMSVLNLKEKIQISIKQIALR